MAPCASLLIVSNKQELVEATRPSNNCREHDPAALDEEQICGQSV
jgi:hypothetical protein